MQTAKPLKSYLSSQTIVTCSLTLCVLEVRMRGKIRNRDNPAPHLTQDTNGKMATSQLNITNDSQEVSPFPADDHKASINSRAQKHNKYKAEMT